MPVAAEGVSQPRRGGAVPPSDYSFHREYLNHEVFEVSITDTTDVFRYRVRTWKCMVTSVNAFTTSIAHVGTCQRVRRDIYMTGYASANGCNVRVSPV